MCIVYLMLSCQRRISVTLLQFFSIYTLYNCFNNNIIRWNIIRLHDLMKDCCISFRYVQNKRFSCVQNKLATECMFSTHFNNTLDTEMTSTLHLHVCICLSFHLFLIFLTHILILRCMSFYFIICLFFVLCKAL